MTMKTSIRVAMAGTILVVGMAALALSPMGGRMAKELGLTPDQTQKLQEMRYEHQKQAAGIRSQLRVKMLDLRREMEKDSPDPAALDRMVDEAAALKASLHKARIHDVLAAKKILTPEQWLKARERFIGRLGRGDGLRKGGRGHRRGGSGLEQGPGSGRGPSPDSGGFPSDED
jgi:Spy/CpxP family protein refolding chaperone